MSKKNIIGEIVEIAGMKVELTEKEFDILTLLIMIRFQSYLVRKIRKREIHRP